MTLTKTVSASLTHHSPDKLSKADISVEFQLIKNRLENEFKDNPAKKTELLQLLDALSEFALGRFLIKNKSLSGYWTWYVIQGGNTDSMTSPVEKYLIERAPAILATRQRFALFQSLLIQFIQSDSIVCSLPCGMMADLLTLNLSAEISGVRFVGIDLDATAFVLAKALAKQLQVKVPCEFVQQDAWELNVKEKFDLITTNGLNIYEKEDGRVVTLYRTMWSALKKQGRLICSALTPPPSMTAHCEWAMDKIDKNDLQTSMMIFKIILNATWSNFRSSEQTYDQLRQAGFDHIEIFWDEQKMFPTFLAQK